MLATGIAEFKSRCLKILQKVHETGIPVLITKRNKPLALVILTALHRLVLFKKNQSAYLL
jgi:prevent-host-death family protein